MHKVRHEQHGWDRVAQIVRKWRTSIRKVMVQPGCCLVVCALQVAAASGVNTVMV